MEEYKGTIDFSERFLKRVFPQQPALNDWVDEVSVLTCKASRNRTTKEQLEERRI